MKPCALRIACCLAVALSLAASSPRASAQTSDRVERRSEQMAIPDPYLDPSWPDDGEEHVAPADSDNVQEEPLDDDKPDAAEAEEAERYKEELSVQQPEAIQPGAPDEMQQDQMGAATKQPEPDKEEARDPAQW
jgi:hypothetical protein